MHYLILFLLICYSFNSYAILELVYDFEYSFMLKGSVYFTIEDNNDHGLISMEVILNNSLLNIKPITGNIKCTTMWQKINNNYFPKSHNCNIGNVNNMHILYDSGQVTNFIVDGVDLSNNKKNFSVFSNSYDFLYAIFSMSNFMKDKEPILSGWQVFSVNGVNFYNCKYVNNNSIACSCSKILDQISRNVVRKDCGSLLANFTDNVFMPQELSWKLSWSSGSMYRVR